VCKHDTNNNRHRGSAYQKHITILKLFGRCEFEYECVVYACLSPHEDVTSVDEEMQEQEAEHAAVWGHLMSVLDCSVVASFLC
jgi:hypothetical protein